MRSGEDGLPDTEGGEAHYLPEHERARTEDDCLRRQDGSPLRDSGERGSIMPLPYAELITRTPSVPIAIWAR